MPFRTAVYTTLATLALAATAGAQQQPHARQGFWIGLGLGAGSLGFGGDAEDADRETGLSGYLKLGGTVSPSFLIGVETNGWTKSEGGVTTTGGAFSAVGYVYPSPTSGFYLKGGLGLFALSDDAFFEGSATGVSGQIGLGYDVRLSRNFSLTPYLNLIASTGAELKIDGVGTGFDINPNLVQFGLGITWH